jgi:predicted RNA-binding Zn-ribbon protein involved in translation (DUF1610 family)
MPKRKHHEDEEPGDDYKEAACPECEATITARFARGRRTRRLRCPVCDQVVTLALEPEAAAPPLVQLHRADKQ